MCEVWGSFPVHLIAGTNASLGMLLLSALVAFATLFRSLAPLSCFVAAAMVLLLCGEGKIQTLQNLQRLTGIARLC